MSEERSLSIKVYLDVGGGRQEVRRFAFPENLATNFRCLKEKVASVFTLGNKEFTISWKDAEGDLIVISSDDELMEALADSLSNQNLQLLRITVTVGSRPDVGPNNSVPGNQQGPLHEGIVCDSCEGPVRGFRYRCVSCEDFDLCGACEVKGIHAEHKMMRLSKPLAKGSPWFFWRESEDSPGNFTSHFGVSGGTGPTCFTSSSTSGAGTGAGAGAGAGAWSSWGGRGGRFGHRRGCGVRGPGGWAGWWGRNWGGKTGGGCEQSQSMGSGFGQQHQHHHQQHHRHHHQQHQQQHQQHHQQQQQQQSQQQGNMNSNMHSEFPWTNGCPFMTGECSPQHMAEDAQKIAEDAQKMAEEAAQHAQEFASQMASEHVANVMRGIWTAWTGHQGPGHVKTATASSSSSSTSSSSSNGDTQQPKSSKHVGEDQQQKDTNMDANQTAGEEYLKNVGETVAAMLDPMGIDVEVSVEHNGIRQRCSLSKDDVESRRSPTASFSPSPPKEPESSEQPLASETSANMEVQSDAVRQREGSVGVADVMEVCSPQAGPSQNSGEQMEAEHSSSDIEDWTLVNQDANSVSQGAVKSKSPPTERRVAYPDLSVVEAHPNPVIQRALEQMQSMGYSNDGGWLTNLLEIKQGDINQVLDLLQPVHK